MIAATRGKGVVTRATQPHLALIRSFPSGDPATPGGILALDLSGTVGWAAGHPGQTPACGTWRLSTSPRLGPRFVGYENELIDALERWKPRLVVMEAPLPAMRQGSTDVARQQFGLAAYTEGECERARVQLREQPAHMVRKAVLGYAPTGGTEKIKAEIVAWCHAQGWSPPDHNAGDALVLWAYSCLMERRRPITG